MVMFTLHRKHTSKNVPVICFCSHMDTSPDCSGTNVNPVIHRNIRVVTLFSQMNITNYKFIEHPALAEQIGQDIVTADGTTYLAQTIKRDWQNNGCCKLPDDTS